MFQTPAAAILFYAFTGGWWRQFWHDLTEIVEYAKAGPFELWVIQRAIEGVTSLAEWHMMTTRSECPSWSQANEPAVVK